MLQNIKLTDHEQITTKDDGKIEYNSIYLIFLVNYMTDRVSWSADTFALTRTHNYNEQKYRAKSCCLGAPLSVRCCDNKDGMRDQG